MQEFVLISGVNNGKSLSLICFEEEVVVKLLELTKSMDPEMCRGSQVEVAVALDKVMATTSCSHDHEEDEEEYVLLDLDGVSGQVDIPPNAPYVLTGLDTMNPILVIDNKLKLIGEYEETIGTCFVFNESESTTVVYEETGPSEANLFSGKCIIDPKQTPTKQVKPIARLHKILKFRLLLEAEADIEDATAKQTTMLL